MKTVFSLRNNTKTINPNCSWVLSRLLITLTMAMALISNANANSSLLEEVIVTAQKREQSLQDVGIAITSFTGEQIRDFGFTESVDIARLSSNIAVSGSYGGQMSQFTIRGINQNDFNDHVESVIAVYIDEAYVAMQQGQTFSLFDLQRVEAMKGPQGTLFGRNATGGLVHFLTNKPTEEFEGYADFSLGSFDERRFEAAISGPLSDNVRARISGFYTENKGWLKNLYPEETFVPAELQETYIGTQSLPGAGADMGGVDSNWALRGHLEIDLTQNTTVLITAFASELTAGTSPYQSVPTMAILDAAGNHINTVRISSTEVCETFQEGVGCVPGAFDFDANAVRERPGADWYGYIDPDGNGRTTSSDWAFDGVNTNDTYGATIKLTSTFDNFTLTSITDYKDYKKHFLLDVDASPSNAFFWIADADTETITQEIRLVGDTEKTDWVAGFYYLNIDNTSVHGFGQLPDSPAPFVAWDQPRVANMETISYAVFGQLDYDLSDTLSLTTGLRWTRDEKDYDLEVFFVFPTVNGNGLEWDFNPTAAFPGFFRPRFEDKMKEDLWTWKLQLDWQPNDDMLIYAGVNQGVKAGGFNAGGPALQDADIPYDEEVLLAYEVGLKSTILDGKARFNAAVFYYDYNDYQASRWTGFDNLITNNDATIYGFEFDISASISENLEGMVAFGYQTNEVKDVLIGGAPRVVETAFAPKVNTSGMLRYYFPNQVMNGQLSAQLDANYQSAIWQNLNNFDANRLDSYFIANARVSWKSSDDKLQLSVFVKNFTDESYEIIGFDISQSCGCNNSAIGKPRWWGVNVRYNF